MTGLAEDEIGGEDRDHATLSNRRAAQRKTEKNKRHPSNQPPPTPGGERGRERGARVCEGREHETIDAERNLESVKALSCFSDRYVSQLWGIRRKTK